MREILFRGKSLVNNEWVYGYLIKDGEDTYIANMKDGVVVTVSVIPQTVGQYSGFKTESGHMIFEGDVCLTAPNENGDRFKNLVECDNMGFYYSEIGSNYSDTLEAFTKPESVLKRWEIIGTRYDTDAFAYGL